MKTIQQLLSLFIVISAFTIFYIHPNWLICFTLIACTFNYIYQKQHEWEATFTHPDSQLDKGSITCLPIDWEAFGYRDLQTVSKHYQIPANQKKTVLLEALQNLV